MNPEEKIKKLINKSDVSIDPQTDKRILDDALEQLKQKQSAGTRPDIWRNIMRSPITKIAAAAILFIAALVGLRQFGKLPDVTSSAFGKVVANLRSAQTVSYRITIEQEDQEPQTMYYWTLEPNHQRIEMEDGRIIIVDTFQGKSVALIPEENKAYVTTTPVSPKYILNEYDNIKDLLTNLSDYSQEYIGQSEINGQKVGGFHIKRGDNEIIIWADMDNYMPVKIESRVVLRNKQNNNQDGKTTTITISDIVIGEELDESLFSLSPPEGFSVITTPEPVMEQQKEVMQRLSARIMIKLAKACYDYSKENNGTWPDNLKQAIEYGIEDSDLLNLTDPEVELGCVYIRPVKTYPRCVLIYQAYDVWPEGGIIVSFVDCFTDIIKDEATFIEHLDYTLAQLNE
ncbi:MAG: outer membrane lipoprotein carrier protein LolA [Sedimentisphaerales bacterium]|nr:outer membrane lipoprotein carrier protein LolA [Sedimentisphaerales bacterium]